MKNANRIPETFQTDAEYRQWMERWQQEAREATIEGFKQNRKLNGMTQTELGRKAGISQPNITRFESGSYNPSLDFMVKIAAAMGKRVPIIGDENMIQEMPEEFNNTLQEFSHPL